MVLEHFVCPQPQVCFVDSVAQFVRAAAICPGPTLLLVDTRSHLGVSAQAVKASPGVSVEQSALASRWALTRQHIEIATHPGG